MDRKREGIYNNRIIKKIILKKKIIKKIIKEKGICFETETESCMHSGNDHY